MPPLQPAYPKVGNTCRGSGMLREITVTDAGPPDRPSDAWRIVDAGSPLPRVGRHRTAPRPLAGKRRKGCPAGVGSRVPAGHGGCGAAFRGGPGDLELYEQ
jgi:hypothetical protein